MWVSLSWRMSRMGLTNNVFFLGLVSSAASIHTPKWKIGAVPWTLLKKCRIFEANRSLAIPYKFLTVNGLCNWMWEKYLTLDWALLTPLGTWPSRLYWDSKSYAHINRIYPRDWIGRLPRQRVQACLEEMILTSSWAPFLIQNLTSSTYQANCHCRNIFECWALRATLFDMWGEE